MADVTRKRTGQFLHKLFEILIANPDGLQAGEALAKLRSAIELTDYEKGTYESGGTRFEKIVRFATVDCVKAGWLLKHKGLWTVTDAGRVAFGKYRDPEAFYKEAIRLYKEWRRNKTVTQPETSESSLEDGVPDKVASITFEHAEEQSWNEIWQYLEKMPPYEFQDLVAALLKAMGYHIAWIAPPGKDGGVDILAQNDPLGAKPASY
ncbi:restriction endonuclease [Nitrospira sp. Nam74]